MKGTLRPRWPWPRTLAAIGLYAATVLFMIFKSAPAPVESFDRYVWPLTDLLPGDQVNITANVVRRASNCSSHVTRLWIFPDGSRRHLAPQDIERLPSGREVFSAKINIPKDAPPGELRLRVWSEFSCNFVQRWFGGPRFVLPDVVFQVRPLP